MMLDFNNKEVLVIGYGVTGKATTNYLLKKGAKVTVLDRGEFTDNPSVPLHLAHKAVFYDKHTVPSTILEETYDLVVKSPGISPLHEDIVRLKERGLPIVGDIELVYQDKKPSAIGITGTNGKTTTTIIVDLMLKELPQKTWLAGNIGIPVLEVAEQIAPDDEMLLELSSFQLDTIFQFKPHIAAFTNILSAHIDNHGTREDYVNAKLKLIQNVTEEDYVIYNADSQELTELVSTTEATLIPFAIHHVTENIQQTGAYIEDGYFMFCGEKVASVASLFIKGEHNLENVLVAIAIAKLKGVSNEYIEEVLRTFKGVPHRIQWVASSEGRTFYNDSKSTNPTAAITALKTFTTPVIYIGGGMERSDDYRLLLPYLGHVKHLYLYGQSKDIMAKALESANIPITLGETLAEVTKLAYASAVKGDTVLLSPSCASWGQFKNFEQRGEMFIELIQELIATQPYEGGEA